MKRLVLLFLFTLCQTSFGQHDFGFKASGGLSSISDKLYDPYPKSQKIYFMPSGQVGFFYNLPIRTYEVFGVELLFSQIEGKDQVVDTVGAVFNSNGTTTPLLTTHTISKHISYLSLPIYYGINFKKFTFNIGVQVSARLISRGEETIQRNYNFNSTTLLTSSTTNYSTDRLSVKDADIGETVRIIYHLTNAFAIEGNYYYGLNNIYPRKTQPTIWKTQQMTIGLRYKFLTTKQKDATENK